MQFAADLICFAILLFLAEQWLRRRGLLAAGAVFFALPAVLTQVWVLGGFTSLCRQLNNPEFFCWLKLYTMIVTACWVSILRFIERPASSGAQLVSLSVLLINLAEAVVQGLFMNQLPHSLNAIAGTLLLLTVPVSPAFCQSQNGACRDLDFQGLSRTWIRLSRMWILGYTIWNWVFVYLTYPVVAGQQLVVLAVALTVGWRKPGRWLQARAYTLTLSLYLLFTFPVSVATRIGTVEWNTPRGSLLGALVSLGFMLLFTAALVRVRWRERVGHLLDSNRRRESYLRIDDAYRPTERLDKCVCKCVESAGCESPSGG